MSTQAPAQTPKPEVPEELKGQNSVKLTAKSNGEIQDGFTRLKSHGGTAEAPDYILWYREGTRRNTWIVDRCFNGRLYRIELTNSRERAEEVWKGITQPVNTPKKA